MRDAKGRWVKGVASNSTRRKLVGQSEFVAPEQLTLILQNVDGEVIEWTARKAAAKKLAEAALEPSAYAQIHPEKQWEEVDEIMASHRARLQVLVTEWLSKRRSERDIPFEVDLEIRQLCNSLWIYREALKRRACALRGKPQEHTND